MSVVDLLVTIVVVTILVTVVLAVVTYVAYKLRLSREPAALDTGDGDVLRYFARYEPEPGSFPARTMTATGSPERGDAAEA